MWAILLLCSECSFRHLCTWNWKTFVNVMLNSESVLTCIIILCGVIEISTYNCYYGTIVGWSCLYLWSEDHGWTAVEGRATLRCSHVSALCQWQQPARSHGNTAQAATRRNEPHFSPNRQLDRLAAGKDILPECTNSGTMILLWYSGNNYCSPVHGSVAYYKMYHLQNAYQCLIYVSNSGGFTIQHKSDVTLHCISHMSTLLAVQRNATIESNPIHAFPFDVQCVFGLKKIAGYEPLLSIATLM